MRRLFEQGVGAKRRRHLLDKTTTVELVRIPSPPETRDPKPETRNPKPESRKPKAETRNPKPESQIRKQVSMLDGALFAALDAIARAAYALSPREREREEGRGWWRGREGERGRERERGGGRGSETPQERGGEREGDAIARAACTPEPSTRNPQP